MRPKDEGRREDKGIISWGTNLKVWRRKRGVVVSRRKWDWYCLKENGGVELSQKKMGCGSIAKKMGCGRLECKENGNW